MLSALADRQAAAAKARVVRLIDATPDPARPVCRLGRLERPHPRHEDARRLRSQRRSSALRRHHRCQRQRYRGRPQCRSRPAHLCLRQGLLPLSTGGPGINDAGAFFVTRTKINMRALAATAGGRSSKRNGDGFTILDDAEVKLVSKGDSKLADPDAPHPPQARRRRQDRPADQRSRALRRRDRRPLQGRWQIELLFRWIKQHLKIRNFLGNNHNAIRLQLFAAMIAYLLLRIAARQSRVSHPRHPLRRPHRRSPLHPPSHRPTSTSPTDQPQPTPPLSHSPNQMAFAYA